MVRWPQKGRIYDNDYSCILCGGGTHPVDPLEVIQAGGGLIWAHAHCCAQLDVEFALSSVKNAIKLLHQRKFDARGAVKCIDAAISDLRAAKDDLTGNSLWPNLI
jgi:hypothetical protein